MTAAGDQYGATASRASYEAELEHIGRKAEQAGKPKSTARCSHLQQQVDEENFRNYLQAVNDARVTDDLNRQRISSIAVIQSPTEPAVPSRPRVKLILAAAFLLGSGGGHHRWSCWPRCSTKVSARPIRSRPFLACRFSVPLPCGVAVWCGRLRVMRNCCPIAVAAGANPARSAFGFDQLDPAYGNAAGVRDQSGNVTEILYPRNGEFDRSGTHGQQLGFAKANWLDTDLLRFEGRQTSSREEN